MRDPPQLQAFRETVPQLPFSHSFEIDDGSTRILVSRLPLHPPFFINQLIPFCCITVFLDKSTSRSCLFSFSVPSSGRRAHLLLFVPFHSLALANSKTLAFLIGADQTLQQNAYESDRSHMFQESDLRLSSEVVESVRSSSLVLLLLPPLTSSLL